MEGSTVETQDNETPRALVPSLFAIVNNEQPVTKHSVELVEDGNIYLMGQAAGAVGTLRLGAAYPNTAKKFFWGGPSWGADSSGAGVHGHGDPQSARVRPLGRIALCRPRDVN
jgi:hypothetical protein